MSAQQRSILRDIGSLWGGVIATQVIGFVLAIYTRKHIEPREMGIWAIFQTFLGYASYAGFVYDGVFREIPIARGGGEHQRARHLANVAFTFILLTAAAISMIVLSLGIWRRGSMDPPVFWGMLTFSVLNVLMRWNNFSIGHLYAEKKFSEVGRFRSVSAVANAVLIVGMVGRWGIYGFYGAMTTSLAFNIWYLCRLDSTRFAVTWDSVEIGRLLKVSAGLGLAGAGHTLLSSVDRLAIGRFLGLESLGLYTLAMMGSGYILMFSYMSTAVLYPRILERFGEKKDHGDLIAHARGSSLLLSWVLPAGIGAAWLFSPLLTTLILPRYAGGVPALKALVVSAAIMTLINQQGQLVIAFGRQMRMVLSYGAALAASLIGYWIVRSVHAPLEGYAWVTTASFLLVYAFQIDIAGKGTIPLKGRVLFFLRMILPMAAVVAALFFLDFLWPGDGWDSTLIRAFLFLPVFCWLGWMAEKDTGSVRVIWNVMMTKLIRGPRQAS